MPEVLTKQEAIDFIYSSYLKAEKLIPYEEKDALRRSPDLLESDLNDGAFRSTNILVTGSKGKGSTARFIAALLSKIGAVGLVTSPEVLNFCDRIQTVRTLSDAEGNIKTIFSKISDEDFVRIISEIVPRIKEIDEALPREKYVSPIGIVALVAQKYFFEIKHKVFECGKGAKYDDTNRIRHQVAVITSIFLEHRRELGNTIEEIAEDKACIVTDDVKVCVSGRQKETVAEIIEKRCKEKQAEFYLYGRDFSAKNISIVDGKTVFDFESISPISKKFDEIEIPLLGDFQAENAATAIETILAVFSNMNIDNNIYAALKSVNYPGRLEVFRKDPLVVIDNTINRASAENIIQVLKKITCEKYSVILSIPNDKDFLGVAETLKEITDEFFLMPLKNPHYRIDAEAEKEILEKDFADASLEVNIIGEDEFSDFVRGVRKPVLFCGVTAMVKEVHEVLQ